MGDVYRRDPVGDPLGEPERESEAIKVFGRWRDRTRMLFVLTFAIPGIILGGVTWYLVQEYQFAHNYGRALLVVNVGSAAIAWGAMFFVGALLGRTAIRQRTPRVLEQLAKEYDVPLAKLQETATMVNKL